MNFAECAKLLFFSFMFFSLPVASSKWEHPSIYEWSTLTAKLPRWHVTNTLYY